MEGRNFNAAMSRAVMGYAKEVTLEPVRQAAQLRLDLMSGRIMHMCSECNLPHDKRRMMLCSALNCWRWTCDLWTPNLVEGKTLCKVCMKPRAE